MKTLATPGLICLSTVMCVAQSGEKLLNQLDSEQLAAITKQVTQPALIDDQVNAAIMIGASDKDKAGSDIGITLDDVAQKWANVLNADTKSAQHSGFGVRLFSPSAWVAWNAHEAKRKYMNYASADVGASDRLQVLRIIVTPDTPTQVIAGRGMAS